MPTYPTVTGSPIVIDDAASTLAAVQNTGTVTLLIEPLGRQVAPGGTVTVPCWSNRRTRIRTAGQPGSASVTLTAGTPAVGPGPGAVTFDPGAAASMSVSVAGGSWFTDEGLTTAATFPRTVSTPTVLYPSLAGSVTVTLTVGSATKTMGLRVDFGGAESVRWEPTTDAERAATDVSAGTGTYGQMWATPAASTILTGTLAAWTVTAVDCTAGTGTRSLPAASSVAAGTAFVAKKSDITTNTLVVSRAGSDLIFGTGSGSTTKTLTLAGEAVEFVSNGVDRYTVRASDTPSGALSNMYAAWDGSQLTVAGAPISVGTTSASLIYGLDESTTDSTLARPWKTPAPLSGNIASGTITLPYSLTSTATSQTVRAARIPLTSGSSEIPSGVRVLFTASIPDTSSSFGGATMTISPRASNGTSLNVDVIAIDVPGGGASGKLNYVGMVEVDISPIVGIIYLDINFVFPNNYTGTVAITELDVRFITHATNPLRVGGTGAAMDTATSAVGAFMIDRPAVDVTGNPVRIRTLISTDVVELAYASSTVFRESLYPASAPGGGTKTGSTSNLDQNQVVTAPAPIHVGNNDMILAVQKADTSFELRLNTHGGEAGRTGVFNADFIFEYDRGDGTWMRCHGDGQQMYAHRARFTMKTKVTRTGDGSPFANLDRIYTFFPDGVVRVDRTITFLASTVISRLFYFMNSLDAVTSANIGRIGNGSRVVSTFNSRRPSRGYIKVNGAHLSGVTTINYTGTSQMVSPGWKGSRVKIGTGGTAEICRVTAVAGSSFTVDTATSNAHASGETIAQVDDATALAAATLAGATTITTSEIVAQNARVVIDQGKDQEIRRLTGVTTAGSPYTLTLDVALDRAHASGAVVQMILPGDDVATNGLAEWCAYQEPQYGVVFGQVVDRRQIYAKGIPGKLTTAMTRNTVMNFISKIYTFIVPPTPATIASGTVWQDTLWLNYYVPADSLNFHSEMSQLSQAGPTGRASVYPNT